MDEEWELIDDLLGGTRCMRSRGKKWLPREPKERDDEYNVRLNRSILYEALPVSIDRIVAKPFTEKIATEGTLPDQLLVLLEDCDGTGRDITQFGRSLFHDSVAKGKSHFLVDFPPTDGRQSRRSELAGVVRPYFVEIPARDLFYWRWRRSGVGRIELDEIRWREVRNRRAGDFLDEEALYIRRWTAPGPDGPGVSEVYVREAEGEFMKLEDESRTHTFPGIPLVTDYTKRMGLLEAAPPLRALAWKNLEHWQKASDHSNILHHAQVPGLMRKGFNSQELKKPLVLGAGRNFGSTNPDATVEWIEPKGGGLTAGRQELQDLQAQMEILGLKPLMRKVGSTTATENRIDEGNVDSDAQMWAMGLERSLRQGLVFAAQWLGLKVPDDFTFNVFSDFGIEETSAEHLQALHVLAGMGKLSDDTLLREHKRRGVLVETLDIEEELARIEEQGPPLEEIGLSGDGRVTAPSARIPTASGGDE